MDAVHKQEFRVRDLPTRTVTLFPNRAQIVRDIKDVALKTGTNQIAVVGFSPTIDENSIKVEGTGAAIISDIAVELLPNREIFQEIYPEEDEEDYSDTDDDDDDDDDNDDETSPELKEVLRKKQALLDDAQRSAEVVASAESRLKFLDAYGKTLDRKRSVDIDTGLATYRTERSKVFQDSMEGTVRCRELAEAIQALGKEEARLLRQQNKAAEKVRRARERARAARRKAKDRALRRKEEERKERLRVRQELEKYWPRQCYTMRITLDVPMYTPSSSRRTSIASITDLAKAAPGAGDGAAAADDENSGGSGGGASCDLAIAYVTSSAFWSPTYDLQLSTTGSTASLCFDAQLTNTTSEAWTGCKVVLSTSQTTFSGLSDTIPTLVPWRVKLHRGYGYDAILNSREEVALRAGWKAQQNALVTSQKPRSELFGVPLKPGNAPVQAQQMQQTHLIQPMQPIQPMQQMLQMQKMQQMQMQQMQQTQQMPQMQQMPQVQQMPQLSRPMPAPSMPPPPPLAMAASVGRGPIPKMSTGGMRCRRISPGSDKEGNIDDEASSDSGGGGGEADMLCEPGGMPQPELGFQESSFEETGMTTTYDLPGVRTLAPGSTASKQRVARIAFQNVVFSHAVVAKYKPAAYLKARLKNASKLTLLKGTAGLTLDGSFLGRTMLPRCSAGDSFTLSLGVDPAIRVAYPKPDVKRATTGIFSKEDSNVYRRSVTIANTRASAGKPVTLLVLDQVPVSEDEKLRVQLLQPRGVSVGGAPVAAGIGMAGPAAASGTAVGGVKDWGTATATLKKDGEVVWDVKLSAGRTVRLDLEYDVSAPTGEGVQQC